MDGHVKKKTTGLPHLFPTSSSSLLPFYLLPTSSLRAPYPY